MKDKKNVYIASIQVDKFTLVIKKNQLDQSLYTPWMNEQRLEIFH